IGLGAIGLGKYVKYIPYPVVSGFMTAIGVIIIITQILPLVGYYPKEDADLVDKFKPQANEVLLDKILKEEAAEGWLVLDDFEEAIARVERITEEDIRDEAEILASSEASGVIGAVKIFSRAMSNISFIELILALLTLAIIY